jgi:DNA-binding MarR family transcriptional regulator
MKSSAAPISDQQLCLQFVALIGRFKLVMATIAEEHNLTSIQLGALHAIDQGNITMGRVANKMHCDASNVTGIIDRLHTLGLVTRLEDPNDRRVKTLQLTVAGNKVLRQITDELPNRLGCQRLGEAERATLNQTINKLLVD